VNLIPKYYNSTSYLRDYKSLLRVIWVIWIWRRWGALITIRSCLVRFSLGFTIVKKTDKIFSSVSGIYILVPRTTMKRGYRGSSKKEPADSHTIRKSTREVSINTLQATAIDSVDQKSIDRNTTPNHPIWHGSLGLVEVARREQLQWAFLLSPCLDGSWPSRKGTPWGVLS